MWMKAGGPSGMAILQRYEKSPKAEPGYEIALDYCNNENCDIIVRLRNNGPDSGIEVKSTRRQI